MGLQDYIYGGERLRIWEGKTTDMGIIGLQLWGKVYSYGEFFLMLTILPLKAKKVSI